MVETLHEIHHHHQHAASHDDPDHHSLQHAAHHTADNETQAGYCGKYLFVFDGQTCPQHRHTTKHETFFVVKGQVRMQFGERAFNLGEGDVLPVPPGTFHSFTGLGPALLLELSMPCEIDDNDFADQRIPIGKKKPLGT